MDKARFRKRAKLMAALDKGFTKSRPGPETEGHHAIYGKADRMMHSKRIEAFELDREPAAVRKAYGEGKFGAGCLMARRLVERGVKVVEVQLNGWDTHQDNFNRTKALGSCGYVRRVICHLSKAASKATFDGVKSSSLTNMHDSRAPCSRSIPESSHSTDSGPP